MKILQPIISLIGSGLIRTGKNLQGKSRSRRGYEAGRVTRLNSDWVPGNASINYDIRNSLRAVRNRSRDLLKNNPYANSIEIKNKTNIVGHEGFQLQSRAKNPDGSFDEYANALIEEKFSKWCQMEYCTMSGRFTFLMVQWMLVNTLKFDGEFLVRMITNVPLSENPFGFSLEILDPEDLDETYSEDLGNGRVVIMGVEIDEWRKIHGFYFKKKNLKDELWGGNGRSLQRIDATDIIYGFDSRHPKQVRGMTKLASVMSTLFGIDRWEESSLINSTLAANKMGFLIRKSLEAEEYGGGAVVSENGQVEAPENKGGKYSDFEAGIIEELPYGYEFTGFDPKFPHEQHAPFLKSMLRKISSAFGFNYNSFSSDLEGVNFSSMRSGLLDERDNWMCEQSLFRDIFLDILYKNWLKKALQTKEIDLPYAKYEKFLVHIWQGRRWPWVDPMKDIQADILAVKMGWKTNSMVAAERGGDYLENLEQLELEYRMQAEKGLKLGDDISMSLNAGASLDDDEVGARDNKIIKLKAI